MMSCCLQYCISGTMNNVLSDGNHMNDNHTITSSSFLFNAAAAAAAAVAGASPYV